MVNENLSPSSKSGKLVIELREVEHTDLAQFFAHQTDPVANHMAAFTAKNPFDWGAFRKYWAKILADKAITLRTILFRERVAGYILCHTWYGEPEVSYWIGKEFWGRGIATTALSTFLSIVETRPLNARAAKDNFASLRVLEKCGFSRIGEEKGFSNARGEEVEEYLLHLAH